MRYYNKEWFWIQVGLNYLQEVLNNYINKKMKYKVCDLLNEMVELRDNYEFYIVEGLFPGEDENSIIAESNFIVRIKRDNTRHCLVKLRHNISLAYEDSVRMKILSQMEERFEKEMVKFLMFYKEQGINISDLFIQNTFNGFNNGTQD